MATVARKKNAQRGVDRWGRGEFPGSMTNRRIFRADFFCRQPQQKNRGANSKIGPRCNLQFVIRNSDEPIVATADCLEIDHVRETDAWDWDWITSVFARLDRSFVAHGMHGIDIGQGNF